MNERIANLVRSATAAFARLSSREQTLVTFFGVLAGTVAIWSLLISPVLTARTRAEKRITALSDEIVAMRSMAERIHLLEKQVDKPVKQRAAGRDFSLFAFIDATTSATVGSEAVAAMNPSRRRVREGVEETAVELRLNKVSLPEIVGLLRRIEQTPQPVYVKRIELKRRFDDHTRFDAVVITGAIAG